MSQTLDLAPTSNPPCTVRSKDHKIFQLSYFAGFKSGSVCCYVILAPYICIILGSGVIALSVGIILSSINNMPLIPHDITGGLVFSAIWKTLAVLFGLVIGSSQLTVRLTSSQSIIPCWNDIAKKNNHMYNFIPVTPTRVVREKFLSKYCHQLYMWVTYVVVLGL